MKVFYLSIVACILSAVGGYFSGFYSGISGANAALFTYDNAVKKLTAEKQFHMAEADKYHKISIKFEEALDICRNDLVSVSEELNRDLICSEPSCERR